MNLLGKFFTVTIALLALVFMVLALAVNASHRNWRQVVLEQDGNQPGLKEQIESLTRINNQIRDERQAIQIQLDRELAARRTALAALQTQLDELTSKLSTSEAEVARLTSENTTLAQTDKQRVDQMTSLTSQVKQLRQDITEVRDQSSRYLNETVDLTGQVVTLQGFKQTLEERNKQLADAVTRFEEVMASKGINPDDPLDGSPPDLNGVVVQVDRDNGMALISIGYDEGLRKGHTLDVTRNGRYLTRLRVTRTDPRQAVAEIQEDYSTGVITRGDRVDTTIE